MPVTLLDIAKYNARDDVVGLIEEVISAHPEVTVVPARTISGINYKTLVRTSLPSVTFRSANEDVATVKSGFENRLIETFIMNPQWEADKAVADRSEDGAAAYIAVEAAGVLEAAMIQLAKVFYYGTDSTYGDTKGFPGLLQMYDSTNMVVDAGGSGNSCSSVWAVRFGNKDAKWVWGQNGELAMDDPVEVRVTDASSNPYTAYRQELLAYPGLQVGSTISIARLSKLTDAAPLTDDLLAELVEKFPEGYDPDAFFMTKKSRRQLQVSRTATNATGQPAPRPTEWEGIPIHVTSAIKNTEPDTL